jgi:Domain of unknown function (DUF4386)
VGCSIQALTSLLHLAPLLVLRGGSSLNAFTAEQLQALALIFLRLNAYAFDIYLVFFGLWCVLIGSLIFRSTFLPRVRGVLLTIDFLGWMTYLSPPLARHLFPFIAVAYTQNPRPQPRSGLASLQLFGEKESNKKEDNARRWEFVRKGFAAIGEGGS